MITILLSQNPIKIGSAVREQAIEIEIETRLYNIIHVFLSNYIL